MALILRGPLTDQELIRATNGHGGRFVVFNSAREYLMRRHKVRGFIAWAWAGFPRDARDIQSEAA